MSKNISNPCITFGVKTVKDLCIMRFLYESILSNNWLFYPNFVLNWLKYKLPHFLIKQQYQMICSRRVFITLSNSFLNFDNFLGYSLHCISFCSLFCLFLLCLNLCIKVLNMEGIFSIKKWTDNKSKHLCR